ncbi:ABC transporter ATP-binding protein [Mannheimia varigena]|uniref:ABC transporter ATP-binding protein n=1 Tax=Mannheimia varigena TaxID=85404 RepID=UPI0003E341DB|nr:ATP-binding cassette domain-containing protein [Mannheimia varigena]AHG77903.1 ABC transporter protein [Mannheimia varigena USDA-ARS-USMARC-1312]AWW34946.1 ABC transporter ATP-binding protein [Mannheimia varigena]MDY2947696.1 ATP-binding cassette domain-containing protein [Mannheimia varigena]QLB16569.1 ABC transporter [Mannheimia varigena]TLU76476.1 ABC transporter ATP-binding protein [Mannheimia varigena]
MSMKFVKEQPIIELSNIVVQFASRDGTLFNPKKFTAVNDVSLAIHAGETVGLVGQSGCGKSTLASVMIGLQKPTSGVVKFNGLEMKYGSPQARKYFGSQVSVIFQDPATALNPRMRVLDILKDPMDIHNILQPQEREKRVYDLLSRVGLPRSAALVEPTRLSGGQKQRVAIARALALNPKLIVADEPTSALDVSVRAQVLNLLADLKKELNLAMVFISHDLQTVHQVSDRIVVMNGGQIVEMGDARQVFENPSKEYTRTLIEAAPSLL